MARKPRTNCVKNGVDYYRIKRKVPGDDGPLYKEFYGKSELEAVGKYHDYLNALKEKKEPIFTQAKMITLLEDWFWNVHYRSFTKDSTFARYEGVFNKYLVVSPFVTNKISSVTAHDIQRHFNELSDSESASDNTLKLMKILLKAFYTYAVQQQLVPVNIALSVIIPKKKLSQTFSENSQNEVLDYFTQAEIKTLIEGSKGHDLHAFIKIKIGTGLRRGEMLGLKWSKVNLSERLLDIQSSVGRTYTYTENHERVIQNITSTPKNNSSRRQAPFPETLVQTFKSIKRQQAIDKLRAGDSYEDNDLVFCTAGGTPINPSNLEKSWRTLLKKLSIPHKKIHSLRHTFATQLFSKGVQIEIVSKLLGHKSIETTRQIYVHVLPETKSYTVDMLSDIVK